MVGGKKLMKKQQRELENWIKSISEVWIVIYFFSYLSLVVSTPVPELSVSFEASRFFLDASKIFAALLKLGFENDILSVIFYRKGIWYIIFKFYIIVEKYIKNWTITLNIENKSQAWTMNDELITTLKACSIDFYCKIGGCNKSTFWNESKLNQGSAWLIML